MGAGASASKMESEAVTAAKGLLENDCPKIWGEIDFNGNNIISVAETHKFIQDKTDEHPALKVFIDPNTGKAKQPPLIRAWAKITGYIGGGKPYTEGHKDGFIHKNEFKKFIKYCFLYNELFSVFEDCAEGDRRVSLEEFKTEVPKLVDGTKPEDLEKAFKAIDKNGGGEILFDEFADYCLRSGLHKLGASHDEEVRIEKQKAAASDMRDAVAGIGAGQESPAIDYTAYQDGESPGWFDYLRQILPPEAEPTARRQRAFERPQEAQAPVYEDIDDM